MKWLKLAGILAVYTVEAIARAVRLRLSRICKILHKGESK